MRITSVFTCPSRNTWSNSLSRAWRQNYRPIGWLAWRRIKTRYTSIQKLEQCSKNIRLTNNWGKWSFGPEKSGIRRTDVLMRTRIIRLRTRILIYQKLLKTRMKWEIKVKYTNGKEWPMHQITFACLLMLRKLEESMKLIVNHRESHK